MNYRKRPTAQTCGTVLESIKHQLNMVAAGNCEFVARYGIRSGKRARVAPWPHIQCHGTPRACRSACPSWSVLTGRGSTPRAQAKPRPAPQPHFRRGANSWPVPKRPGKHHRDVAPAHAANFTGILTHYRDACAGHSDRCSRFDF